MLIKTFISLQGNLIKKLTEQVVHLAFSVHVCLIFYDLLMNEYCHLKNCTICTFHHTLSD